MYTLFAGAGDQAPNGHRRVAKKSDAPSGIHGSVSKMFHRRALVWPFLALGLTFAGGACSGGGGDQPADAGPGDATSVACTVTAPTECIEPAPVFSDIQPILEKRCLSCHYGDPDGPWPLTDYEHVASWFAEVRTQMLACSMPPPDAGIQMTNAEREKILMWIRCGHHEN